MKKSRNDDSEFQGLGAMYHLMAEHHVGFTAQADEELLQDVFEEQNTSEYQTFFEQHIASISPPISSEHQPWKAEDSFLVIPGPWQQASCFYMELCSGECFRVDTETDLLSAEDYINYEKEIIDGDHKEIKNFVKHSVFKVKNLHSATQRPMSCVWVRKWKIVNGKRIIKCRLCVRGFLDPQKSMLSKHSTTATRLSQKLIVSNAANNDFDMES